MAKSARVDNGRLAKLKAEQAAAERRRKLFIAGGVVLVVVVVIVIVDHNLDVLDSVHFDDVVDHLGVDHLGVDYLVGRGRVLGFLLGGGWGVLVVR